MIRFVDVTEAYWLDGGPARCAFIDTVSDTFVIGPTGPLFASPDEVQDILDPDIGRRCTALLPDGFFNKVSNERETPSLWFVCDACAKGREETCIGGIREEGECPECHRVAMLNHHVTPYELTTITDTHERIRGLERQKLRDQAAERFAAAFIDRRFISPSFSRVKELAEDVAKVAYDLAEALMKERDARRTKDKGQ